MMTEFRKKEVERLRGVRACSDCQKAEAHRKTGGLATHCLTYAILWAADCDECAWELVQSQPSPDRAD